MQEVTAKHRATAEIDGVAADGDALTLTARVSGDFSASPAALTYRARIAEGRIAALDIG